MLKSFSNMLLLLTLATKMSAQLANPTVPTLLPRIADNSFLIEEAYNQEAGVVQHIATLQRGRGGSYAFSFTQEWPAPSLKHQLSYTIPFLRDTPNGKGIGDIAVNYRFQALGTDDDPLWFAPRLSAYLPTGDKKAGRGAGGVGLEVMLPFSYQVSPKIVTHWNAAALVTRADDGLFKATTKLGRAGASAIWLAMPTFNLMLESTFGREEFLGVSGRVESENSFVVSPGIRGALNFASGLQVVPGIAVPIGIGPSSGQRDAYFYLSLEHPFR